MDWAPILTAAITGLLGGNGTIVTIAQIRKSRAEQVSANELEASNLSAAEEDKTWLRQEQQLVRLEAKLKEMDERLTTVEEENETLRVTIKLKDQTLAAPEMWGAHFVFNVRQASQAGLIPLPIRWQLPRTFH